MRPTSTAHTTTGADGGVDRAAEGRAHPLHALVLITRPERPMLVRAGLYAAVAATARAGIALSAVYAAATVLGPATGTGGTDPAPATGASGRWTVWLAAMTITAVLTWYCHRQSLLWAHRADNALEDRLRSEMITCLRTRPLSWIDDNGTTAVRRLVTDDTGALHHAVAHAFCQWVGAVVQTTVVLAFLAFTAPLPALAATVPTLAALFLAHRQRRQMPAEMERHEKATGKVDRATAEFVRGIAPLKVFGGVRQGLDRFHDAADAYSAFVSRWARKVTPTMIVQQTLLSPPTTWAVLGVLALITTVPPLQLITVALLFPLLLSPVEALSFAAQEISGAASAAGRVLAFLTTPSSPASGTAATTTGTVGPEPGGPTERPASGPPEVILRGLTVLRGRRPVLDAVTTTLPAGGLTVILGHSGSGKTTLLETVAGLAEPTRGEVLSCPDHCTVTALWQHPFIVRASVLDNIRLTSPRATDDDCRAAAAVARIDRTIEELPDGYRTRLQHKSDLSGGELQRLCLARCLVRHPDLLLLDEPTSAVDTVSSRLIDAAVAGLRGTCTVVRTEHRPSLALTADAVLVLRDGHLVEQGTPGELMKRGGLFTRMLDEEQEGDPS